MGGCPQRIQPVLTHLRANMDRETSYEAAGLSLHPEAPTLRTGYQLPLRKG